jgi:23S rRNA (uracil1939-C5)-methyltransferase
VALKENLRGTNGSAVRASTLDFLRGSGKAERPDLIVVDPPRAGLGGEIAALLAEFASPRLVYVSCDPATLARDLRILVASGHTIENMTLVDMFPQTFHLETVVHLRRS